MYPKLEKGWAPDQVVMEDFHRFLLDQGVQFSEADFAQHQDWIKQELRREILSLIL